MDGRKGILFSIILTFHECVENRCNHEINKAFRFKKQKNLNKNNKKDVSEDEKSVNNNTIINLKEEEISKNYIKDKGTDIIRKKSKYKITIKPSYITIEKKENTKKRLEKGLWKNIH